MRLLVDLQGAQTDSRFGSVGRYALGLTTALAWFAKERNDHEIHLLLNDSLGESSGRLREHFADLIAADRIHSFDCIEGLRRDGAEAHDGRSLDARIRETTIARIKPDVVLVTSYFEGYEDCATVSNKRDRWSVRTALIVHDDQLTPSRPGNEAAFKHWHKDKLASLEHFDLLLTTSGHMRQRMSETLPLSSASIECIGLGLDAQFTAPVAVNDWGASLEKFNISRPFILTVGGLDDVDNPEVLVEAFGTLDRTDRLKRRLVFVGRFRGEVRERLQQVAATNGLDADNFVFTGHIGDADLLGFYRSCELFVLPSPKERFSLSALEALVAGAPTLAVRSPTLQASVSADHLLIEPGVLALSQALKEVLGDHHRLESLRLSLPSTEHRFDWNSIADSVFERLRQLMRFDPIGGPGGSMEAGYQRRRLALLSPLPPAPSGIADYCSELIPALDRYYAIELITDQSDIDPTVIPPSIPIRSLAWFEENGNGFERILYHFGNSPFHRHMFGLLERFPGVVVLHDFFFSELLNWLHSQPGHSAIFDDALTHSHGPSGHLLIREAGRDSAISRLPCNLAVLEAADSVLVHSQHAVKLAERWYGSSIARRFVNLPFPRASQALPDRHAARAALSIDDDTVLICTFGMIGPHKRNHLIVAAFSEMPVAIQARCRLVMVGANSPTVYGESIQNQLELMHLPASTITGHVTIEEYRGYLAAADLAVQLRSESRGETSAAVFDALGAGLPLIVNDHGSLAELPKSVVLCLAEDPSTEQLANAIVHLVGDVRLRQSMGTAGRTLVRENHDPASVAAKYAIAIETAVSASPRRGVAQLEERVVEWASTSHEIPAATVAFRVSQATQGFPKRRLFIDVSAIAENDLKTGIQRVVRALLLELLREEPHGYRVEVVRADRRNRVYRYASRYIATLLEQSDQFVREDVIDARSGDLFLGLDLAGDTVSLMPEWFRQQRDRGVRIAFVVYDILPVEMPQFFPPAMDVFFGNWLQTIGRVADEIICISDAVADSLFAWLDRNQPLRNRVLRIGSFRLGADFGASASSRGIPPDAPQVLAAIRSRSSFLMVGTVEPRKGHAQVLAAFDLLWAAGDNVGLVIVGKSGWLMEDFLSRVTSHSEFGKRLFWLQKSSDEYLEAIYPVSTALIAASYGEGFGLPLIEGARHGIPLIARDLKVFREVAGEHAFYFHGLSPEGLAETLRHWLDLNRRGGAPSSSAIQASSWKDSSNQLVDRLFMGTGYREWHFEGEPLHYNEQVGFDSLKVDWEGWSPVEETHRWTDGKVARIGFRISDPAAGHTHLDLTLGTFGRQSLSIFLNDLELFRETAELNARQLSLPIPPGTILGDEQNWIEFRLPDAAMPNDVDVRQLGVRFTGFEVVSLTNATRTYLPAESI